MNYKRLFLIAVAAFVVMTGVDIYQARVIQKQRALITDMWLYIVHGSRGRYQGAEPHTDCAVWRVQ